MPKTGNGMVVPAASRIEQLRQQLNRRGLSPVDEARLIQRTADLLDKACWCNQKVCCLAHQKHTDPHERCAMR